MMVFPVGSVGMNGKISRYVSLLTMANMSTDGNNKIIEFAPFGWVADCVSCANCGTRWAAVYPNGFGIHNSLECPDCGARANEIVFTDHVDIPVDDDVI
jgi:hypothetical protein